MDPTDHPLALPVAVIDCGGMKLHDHQKGAWDDMGTLRNTGTSVAACALEKSSEIHVCKDVTRRLSHWPRPANASHFKDDRCS